MALATQGLSRITMESSLGAKGYQERWKIFNFSGSSNGSIVHVDIVTQKVVTYAKGHGNVRSLVSFAGGKLMASGHGTGWIRLI